MKILEPKIKLPKRRIELIRKAVQKVVMARREGIRD
jgi:hypothetical protein